MDWYPTILELCNIMPTAKLDGRSLLPVIKSPEEPSPHSVLYFQWINSWAVREGDWKLICRQGRGKSAKPRYSLHKLTGERPETEDFADQMPELVARLKGLHDAWLKDVMPAD